MKEEEFMYFIFARKATSDLNKTLKFTVENKQYTNERKS